MSAWQRFFADLLEQSPLILHGLGQTLWLAGVVSVTGFLGGIVVLFAGVSRSTAIRACTKAYVSFFIGTPLLVLLFLGYYGLPQLGIKAAPFTVAVVGFTLNVAAYNAAYLMTAWNGLDAAEMEAANAQGFSHWQVFRHIALPQVLRRSVPALTNQVILNLKDSAIAFLIQYTEFFARIQELAATNFQFYKAYLLAALVYLLLVAGLVWLARMAERRWALPA